MIKLIKFKVQGLPITVHFKAPTSLPALKQFPSSSQQVSPGFHSAQSLLFTAMAERNEIPDLTEFRKIALSSE